MLRKRPFFLSRALAALLCLPGLAIPRAAHAGAALPPVRYENFHQVHQSGLRVVAYQFPGNRMVSVAVSYLGGLLEEPAGKEGVAEIAARLISGAAGAGQGEGAGEVRAPSIGQRLLAQASEFDAEVESRQLRFEARTVPGRLDAVLALEAERLREPLAGVGAVAFEAVKAELAEEVTASTVSASSSRARWAVLGRIVPPDLPHPRPMTRETVEAVTWEDVQAYVKATVRPERAIVAVVGPTPGRAVGAAVERAFGPASGTPGSQARSPTPTVPAGVATPPMPEPRALQEMPGPTRSPRLWVGWVLPKGADRDDRTADVASTLASLQLHIAAVGVGRAGFLSIEDLGPVVLAAASIDLEDENDAAKFLSTLAQVSAVPWTPALVEMAMEFAMVALYDKLENLGAGDLTGMVRLHGGLDPLDEIRSRLVAPVPLDAWKRARSWVRREAALAVLERPEAGRGATAPSGGDTAKPVLGVDDGGPVPSWMVRLPPGSYDVYGIAQPPGLSAAWRETLPNGFEVIGFPRAGFPRIAARLVLRRHGDAPVGLAALALSSRVQQPPPAPACPRLEPQIDGRTILWSRSALRGSLDPLLDLLSCNVVTLRFDRTLFAKRQSEEVKRLERYEKTLGKGARRAEAGAAAAFDPGRTAALPVTADSLDDLSRGQAEDWVAAQLRPDRATLILVGDLPPQDDVMVAIGPRFRNWAAPKDASAPAAGRAPPAPPARRAVFVGDAPDAEWASVQVRVRWRPGAAPDVPAEIVAARELDRRLQRERRRGIRDVAVRRESHPADPALEVTFRVRPELAGEATRRVLDVIGTVAEAPVLAENVAFQRWMIAARFPLAFVKADDTADRLAELVVNGRPADFWDRYPAKISSLGTERVESAASRLAAGREVVFVLGPRKKVVAALTKEGLAVEAPGS